MFILEGLKTKKNIKENFYGLIEFIDQEMNKEKIEEFYERKMTTKGSKRLFRVGFESVNPVRLRLEDKKSWEELSLELKVSKNYFHPIFLSNNITNGQYRKLIGNGTEFLYKNNNSGSFSDYFITRKVFESVNKGISKDNGTFLPEVDVKKVNKSSLKYKILEQFYELVAALFSLEYQQGDITGMEFFIDFNTIFENQNILEKDSKAFLYELLNESGIIIPFVYEDLKLNQELNGFIYMLESILFQAEDIFGIKVSEYTGKEIEEILSEEVGLTFEVPTNEKPLLENPRNQDLGKKTEIPKATILEMVLIRFLVLVINKQGTTSQSGFRFLITENEDSINSIVKELQVVSDKNGNLSINEVNFFDVKKEEKFKRNVLKNRKIYLNVDTPDDENWKVFFVKELNKTLKNFMSRYPKEEENIWKQLDGRKYNAVSKAIYDGVYRNIDTRVLGKLMKDNELVYLGNLKSLLFVIDTLKGSNDKERMLKFFMSSKLIMEDLLAKEKLTNEESFYILGKICGHIVRSSRNKDSLIKSVLKKSRTKDILELVNKRFESGYEEIEHKGMLKNWMTKLLEDGHFITSNNNMAADQKFTFITGLISETNTFKKDNFQEEK